MSLWNSRSLVNKLTSFQSFAYSSKFNFFAITETWLNSSIFDNEILPSSFTIFRRDRGSRGGGVMLAIKDNIPSKLLMSQPELEAVTVQILSKFSFILCLVYLSPNSLINVFDTLSTHITNLCHKNLPIIILGDFNTPDINWDTLTGSSSQSNLFCDLVFHLNLLQLVDKPTHIQGNTLDLIFTNKEDLIDNVTVQPQEAFCVSSDHFMVSFNLCLPSYSSTINIHIMFLTMGNVTLRN